MDWEKISVPWWVSQHQLAPTDTARFVAELNAELSRFASSHAVTLVDMAAAFDGLDRVRLQPDFAHMYADGYELMAWTFFDALRARGALSGRDNQRHADLLAAYRLRSPATLGRGR